MFIKCLFNLNKLYIIICGFLYEVRRIYKYIRKCIKVLESMNIIMILRYMCFDFKIFVFWI